MSNSHEGSKMPRSQIITIIALSSLAVCNAPAAAQDGSAVAAGRELARKLCAGCHAISRDDNSKLPKAPPFRVIAQRYSVWSLQESLAEGIVTGHAAMPQFVFNPDQIDQLLTYMDTFTVKKGKTK